MGGGGGGGYPQNAGILVVLVFMMEIYIRKDCLYIETVPRGQWIKQYFHYMIYPNDIRSLNIDV